MSVMVLDTTIAAMSSAKIVAQAPPARTSSCESGGESRDGEDPLDMAPGIPILVTLCNVIQHPPTRRRRVRCSRKAVARSLSSLLLHRAALAFLYKKPCDEARPMRTDRSRGTIQLMERDPHRARDTDVFADFPTLFTGAS
jgi:hypothetical protein